MRGEAWRRFMISRVGRVSVDECPCNGCKTRDQGCHGKCRRHLVWQMQTEVKRRRIQKREKAEKDILEYFDGRLKNKHDKC